MEKNNNTENEAEWNSNAIQCLLTQYLEHKDDFRDPKRKKKCIYGNIAYEMSLYGHKGFDGESVDRKFRNLKGTYDRIREKARTTGQEGTKWRFYTQMHEIFGGDSTYVSPAQTMDPLNGEDFADTNYGDTATYRNEFGEFVADTSRSRASSEVPSILQDTKKTPTNIAMDKISSLDTLKMEIRKKQMQFEAAKFKWTKEFELKKLEASREKFEWEKKIEMTKMAMEERKLKMEEQRMQNEHELRLLELKYKYGK